MVRRLALVALVAVGCGPTEVEVPLNLVTASCSASSPVALVTHYLFRVTGAGMATLETTGLATEVPVLPRVPTGPVRVVEVRAFEGQPASGRLVSVGRTAPFEVAASAPPSVTVFLRLTSALTPLNLASAPATCAQLAVPRAGHTATALPDGRALVAGGFTVQGGSRVATASAELFDPKTGGFAAVPDMPGGARAFHTATLLNDGRVLVVGGESYSGATIQVAGGALLFDPAAASWSSLATPLDRTQHGAARDTGGRVLVVGGLLTGGTFAQSVEWFDPGTGQIQTASGLALGRVQMGVAPVQGGRFVAVVGGSTSIGVTDEVRLYGFDALTQKFQLSTIAQLGEPRRAAPLSSVTDASHLIALGGLATLTDGTGLSPLASSEVIATDPTVVPASGPAIAARGDACAASLPDRRVLVSGGRAPDVALAPRSSNAVELIVPGSGTPSALGMPALSVGRHFHTCTTLADGTVLIAGGVSEQSGVQAALQDAVDFTAVPLD